MKKFFFICFLLLVTAQALASTAPEVCWQNPIFIRPVGKKMAQKNWQRLITQQPEIVQQMKLSLPELGLNAEYQADIDNTGKLADVYVVTDGGSGQYETIVAVRKYGKGYILLGEPPRPANAGDGPWYLYRYTNTETGQDQFITQLCGKTYLSFDDNLRSTYLWKDKQTVVACDADWLHYAQFSAQQLSQTGLYKDAFAQLNSDLNRCQTLIKPSQSAQYLTMKNDLALIALKADDPGQCLSVLAAIKQDPAFINMPTAFQKTFAINQQLCTAAAAKPPVLEKPQGPNAYAWLFSSDSNKFSTAEYNSKLQTLIDHSAPGISINTLTNNNGNNPQNFRTELYFSLKNKMILNSINHRYVFTDNMLRDCLNANYKNCYGFIWVDVQQGISLAGVVSANNYYLSSLNLTATTVPPEAKQMIKNNFPLMPPQKIFFYDYLAGKIVVLPNSWLDGTNS